MKFTDFVKRLDEKWGVGLLGDHFELKNGINFSADQKGQGILTLDVKNMFGKGTYIDPSGLYRVDIVPNSERILKDGDILFVRSSVKREGVGWASAFQKFNEPVSFCGFLIRARALDGKFDSRFLVYYLRQTMVRDCLISSSGQVAITNISQENLSKLPIPLPPLAEQKRIAGILDAADALRAKRRESLAQLDTLLQSTFIDMFGDPVTNPKGWDTEIFDEWLSSIDSGWSPKCLDRKANEDEWGVLKLSAVTWCEFNENEQKALPADQRPRKEIEIQSGDLLFTRKNTYELVAAVAYVHQTRPKLMLSDLIFRLRIKPDVEVDQMFLWHLLKQPHQRQKIQELAGGAAGSMPNISKTKLKTIHLIKPPITLQRRFAIFVEKVEKQKSRLRVHLAELDTLFAALQSRAFNGEL